jgi:hypothetical protein
MRFRVRARLGPKAAEPIEDLKKVVVEISVAATQLAMMGEDGSGQKPSQATRERRRKHEEVIWQYSKDDAIALRANKAIKRSGWRPETGGKAFGSTARPSVPRRNGPAANGPPAPGID